MESITVEVLNPSKTGKQSEFEAELHNVGNYKITLKREVRDHGKGPSGCFKPDERYLVFNPNGNEMTSGGLERWDKIPGSVIPHPHSLQIKQSDLDSILR